MDPSKFTTKAQQALEAAFQMANEHGQAADVTHLALALIDQSEGTTTTILNLLEKPIDRIKSDLESARRLAPSQSPMGGGFGQVMITQDLGRILNQARINV